MYQITSFGKHTLKHLETFFFLGGQERIQQPSFSLHPF